MEMVLLALSLAVAVGGFYAAKRAQPPSIARVRGVSDHSGES